MFHSLKHIYDLAHWLRCVIIVVLRATSGDLTIPPVANTSWWNFYIHKARGSGKTRGFPV